MVNSYSSLYQNLAQIKANLAILVDKVGYKTLNFKNDLDVALNDGIF